ncbi:hypothetical protein [Haliscomenobacter hydrossis]|uniref:Uncharacterized protein n=1 Tax=Haliscomenobacter hydrossis (strain ATCC 27775 / DSM 1100 / LMG 10767 / O) TaxID=760192 RepID=F4L1E0_HALH1|nr:hypothetical protein [Haliscomenobacter hydrossis]AEE53837.1 hypothetical protein Halhy_6014 [Haliscomenobacter hydrossis DSM 1100]
MLDLFTTKIPVSRLNKNFIGFQKHRVYKPGRALINEIFNRMGDQDGNFIEDFQSGGFSARLLELFLFEFINEQSINIINTYNRPDFHLEKGGCEFFIEATTSNISSNEIDFTDKKMLNALWSNNLSFQDESLKHYTIKIGSALFSKLNKNYQELNWVKDKPLLIALTPSHHVLSSFIPDYKLFEYLYGLNISTTITEKNELIGTIGPITEHSFGKKNIPSGFFNLPNSEFISGVVFINMSDFWKFNRMGYEKGFHTENIKMMHSGVCFNPKENSLSSKFLYRVGNNSRMELWSDGVKIYHNPNAKNPLNPNIFSGIAQSWINKDGEIDGVPIPMFYPAMSRTFIWDYKFLKENYPNLNDEELEVIQAFLTIKTFGNL